MLADPNELVDLGASDEHAAIQADLRERIFMWLRKLKRRTTVPLGRLADSYGPIFEDRDGVLIGWWEDADGNNFDATFE